MINDCAKAAALRQKIESAENSGQDFEKVGLNSSNEVTVKRGDLAEHCH